MAARLGLMLSALERVSMRIGAAYPMTRAGWKTPLLGSSRWINWRSARHMCGARCPGARTAQAAAQFQRERRMPAPGLTSRTGDTARV